MRTRRLVVTLALIGSAGGGFAQTEHPPGSDPTVRPLTLEEAVRYALDGNPGLAVARARNGMAAAGARRESAPLWPRLETEAGYVRSVDPVSAFGTRLRRSIFGPQDLDIARLNDPDAVEDWYGRLAVQWAVLDARTWARRAGAAHRAVAASWSLARAREATTFETRVLYYRSVRAEARLAAAETARDAARANFELFRRRADAGLLTRADVLQAAAELEAARARRSESRVAARDARRDLGLHFGWGPDTLPIPVDTLSAPDGGGRAAAFDPARRADVRALAASLEAARARRRATRLAFLPALQAFGDLSKHAGSPLSSDATDWTVGVRLRWELFSGFARTAETEEARLAEEIARVEYARAVREAQGAVDRAEQALRSALDRVEATRAAARAAQTARELLRRRVEEGLATATALLQAEARATAMRDRAIDALAQYWIARARLEFARSYVESEQ